MADINHKLPLLLLPGLLNDARLWQQQMADLDDIAQASVADLTRADSIAALATQVLAQAPAGRFTLAGLSMVRNKWGQTTFFELSKSVPRSSL